MTATQEDNMFCQSCRDAIEDEGGDASMLSIMGSDIADHTCEDNNECGCSCQAGTPSGKPATHESWCGSNGGGEGGKPLACDCGPRDILVRTILGHKGIRYPGSASVEMEKPDCEFNLPGKCPKGVRLAVADFRTGIGSWGYGCQQAFNQLGHGLGTGHGQAFYVKPKPAVKITIRSEGFGYKRA